MVRSWLVAVFAVVVVVLAPTLARAQAIIPNAFNASTLAPNDDGSTASVPIGFPINFFSQTPATTLFVNNNGNVTIEQPLGTYTPFPLNTSTLRLIAPFFADVDTSGSATVPNSSGTVTYGPGTVGGRPAFGVNWLNVDYYNSPSPAHTSRNSFQLVLVERADTGVGNFDIYFNYNQIQWETGEASGSNAAGLGGFCARVGYANAQGISFEQTGSASCGALLDSNAVTGLVHGRSGAGNTVNGRYIFQVRNGGVVAPPSISDLTPGRGPLAGSTPVVVHGTGFVVGGTTVTVGNQPVRSLVVSSTGLLSFLTPPGAAGQAPIVISTANGAATAAFSYVPLLVRSLAGARHPTFSYDGRYMVFESLGALVPDDTNGVADVYVLDRRTGAFTRMSVSTSGGQTIGGDSANPVISANGRFVAFESRATNLVPGDTNNYTDVFLHDRDADQDGIFDEPNTTSTTRISVASDGAQATGGNSLNPAINGNGRWTVFESSATNLLGPGQDTNGLMDVFVFDRLLGRTRRANIATDGSQAVGGSSNNPVISLDGRWIAYDSAATNLIGPGADTNAHRDVFMCERDVDGDGVMDEPGAIRTFRASVADGGAEATGGDSGQPSITGEGGYVVFASTASNLVPGDTNGVSDIFIFRNVSQGSRTIRLSMGPNGQLSGSSFSPTISANGMIVFFLTDTSNARGAAAAFALAEGTPIAAEEDDGKTTTGTVPLPTNDTPPPADVPPPDPGAGSSQDPGVSGDGSTSGSTVTPGPGATDDESDVDVAGPPPPEANEAAPAITSLEPGIGPAAGVRLVGVEGLGFATGSLVVWNGASLLPGFRTASVLRVNAPAQGVLPAQVPVQVRSNGQLSNTVTYRYANVSAPVITSFGPVQGTTLGGTTVTITGSNFGAVGTSVRFGPAAAVVTTATPTQLVVTTQAVGIHGPVPIVVENADGGVAVSNGPFTYTMAAAPPSITAILPADGGIAGGTVITVQGAGFVAGTTVTIGGRPATNVDVHSSSALTAVTPAVTAPGPVPLVVSVPGQAQVSSQFTYQTNPSLPVSCTGADANGNGLPDDWENAYGLTATDLSTEDPDGDGRTNIQECQANTHPLGVQTRFLAEGATGTFFHSRIAIANPNVSAAHVLLRFLTSAGQVIPRLQIVPGMERRFITVESIPGLESAAFSTVIESDVEVVVDRTMSWDATGFGSHAETSVPAAALVWYLAEGATHGNFDLFYLIQNPSLTDPATVHVRFLLPSGSPVLRDYVVPPNSRFNIYVDEVPGLEATDVSAVLQSTVPIIVERAMYSSLPGQPFAAGHDSAGVTAPSTQWFLAEGATGQFFDLFILFANPGAADAQVRADYLLADGTTVTKNYTIPANSRRTVYVALEDPQLADAAVSTSVTSTVPIIVERSMWWPHGQPWYEAHNSPGATSTGTKWAVGDGEVGGPHNAQTYILVANTSAATATVRATVLFDGRAPITKEYTVAARSRFNIPVNASEFSDANGPVSGQFSVVIESLGATPAQIVVERAMYSDANGVVWAAGTDLLATRLQ